jgi:phenol 2-monooxygenase
MRDAFNLGWKLAAVLRGQCDPKILHSYSEERHAVAKELIDFDRKLATMFSAKPKTSDNDDGLDPAEFQRYFQQQGRFTAGVATTYRPSVLTGSQTHQHLATGFEIGSRLHSAPVLRAGDAKPVHLGHVVDADGRWRLFLFADEFGTAENSVLAELCMFLADDPRSPIRRVTPDGADVDSLFDVRAIVQSGHEDIVSSALPSILRPTKGPYGLVDYQKVFVPDPKAGQDIYEMRGVSRRWGAMVLVRPDQHVAHVLPLDGRDELADFFGAFMLRVTN